MKQQSFDFPTGYQEPITLARSTDPATSHKAARKIVESGKASAHCRLILDVIRKHPGLTFGEIAPLCGLRAEQVWKRLPELKTAGLAIDCEERKCTVRGTDCRTWRST